MNPNNIHPITDRMLQRSDKEGMLGQKGCVFWFCGLSGSGKSTLALNLERDLHNAGIHSAVLDGDNLRSSLNKDLAFSENDRAENLRRASEVAKILLSNGLVVLGSFISPKKEFREFARSIIGKESFREIYIKAPFETCQQRDVKGLYAKVQSGEIKDFTGSSSAFEEPINPWLTIETDSESPEESSKKLFDRIINEVRN
jgi:adenylylsulfate kinase